MTVKEFENWPHHVLIADDNQHFLAIMKDFLSVYPEIKIKTATNAVQTGMIAKEFQPDVIVLGIKLGGIDGREICKSFRADLQMKDVKILGISGKITHEDEKTLLNQGFDAYLKKPFDGNELYKAINNLLKETSLKR